MPNPQNAVRRTHIKGLRRKPGGVLPPNPSANSGGSKPGRGTILRAHHSILLSALVAAIPLMLLSPSTMAASVVYRTPVATTAGSESGLSQQQIQVLATVSQALAPSLHPKATKLLIRQIASAVANGQGSALLEALKAALAKDAPISMSQATRIEVRTLVRIGSKFVPSVYRPLLKMTLTAMAEGKAGSLETAIEKALNTLAGRTSLPPAPGVPAPPTRSANMVLGYYVPGGSAFADLKAHASQITAIAPVWYSITTAGTIRALASNTATVTSWATGHGVQVYPLVINGYGNTSMLTNPVQMRQNVESLVQLAKTDGYAGFNVDFESLNNPDEAPLVRFVSELATGLHQEGKKVIVSVGPRTSNSNGYHVYNYSALGKVADYVDLMLYDDHDNTGPVGPVAPMNWVLPIVRYASQTIPAAKVLVGIAGYGYNWAADGSVEVNDQQALALAQQYGSTFVGNGIDESKVTYTDARGVWHTVWFEDSTSAAYKVKLVSQYGFGGVALWDLGEENSGFWPMLSQTLS